MTARKDGKPKRKRVSKGRKMPKNLYELRKLKEDWMERAYNTGYRDAMKLMKTIVDNRLRETK